MTTDILGTPEDPTFGLDTFGDVGLEAPDGPTPLPEAIREVAAGRTAHSPELALAWYRRRDELRPGLTPREREILIAYASGLTMSAAAHRVGIRAATARKYLERVKEKYTAAGRPTYTKLDLAARLREDGLLRMTTHPPRGRHRG